MQLAQFAGDGTGVTYISGISNKLTVDLTGSETVAVDASSSSELFPSCCQTSCVLSIPHVTVLRRSDPRSLISHVPYWMLLKAGGFDYFVQRL